MNVTSHSTPVPLPAKRRSTVLATTIVFLIALVAMPTPSRATDFSDPPRLVTSATGYSDPDMAVGSDGQVSIGFTKNGDVYFGSSAVGFGIDWNLTTTPSETSHRVRLAGGASDRIGIIYEHDEDIRLLSWPGNMTAPLSLASSTRAESKPRIAESLAGEFAFVWEKDEFGGNPGIHLQRGSTGAPSQIAAGTEPAVCFSDSGFLHVTFHVGDDVIYRRYPSGATLFDLEFVVPTPPGPESGVSLASVGEDIAVIFTNDSSGTSTLYASYYPLGAVWSGPLAIDAIASGSDAGFAKHPIYGLAIAYENTGQILLLEDALTSAQTTTIVTPPGFNAHQPTVAFDSLGYLHVAYEMSGQIYHECNVTQAPNPDFAALSATAVVQGDSVTFNNTSTGLVWNVDWDFGDGGTAMGFTTVSHTYTEPGSYAVKLTAHGPGGDDSITRVGFVAVDLAPYKMRLPGQIVVPGQSDISLPILGTTLEPTQGFQIAFRYDDSQTIVTELALSDMIVDLGAEFFVSNLEPDGEDSYSINGIIFDFLPPFAGQRLDPIDDLEIASIHFDVPTSTPVNLDAALRLAHPLSDPAIYNIFIVEGQTRICFLDNAPTTIIEAVPFIRGDFDGDQLLNITDAVNVLAYLFSGGGDPACIDAADVDDDGQVNIVDAVVLLAHLFSGGGPLPPPFPTPGLDPTDDPLGTCEP